MTMIETTPGADVTVKARARPARASGRLKAMIGMNVRGKVDEGVGSANPELESQSTSDRCPALIDQLRMCYRRSKAAEQARIRIDLGMYAYARVYHSGWNTTATEAERKKAASLAKRVVDKIRDGKSQPKPEEEALFGAVFAMVMAAEPAREAFEAARAKWHRDAEKLAEQLPAWTRIKHVSGFSAWGLAVIVGEVGDVGLYPTVRKVFKRLGLAPKDQYESGEKKTGKMIPRNSLGRVMGIVAEPLFYKQWAGERGPAGEKLTPEEKGRPENIPGHPRGPFGKVYAEAKQRALEAEKTKGHAENTARRAMVKALVHDVHRAWHDLPLDYA